TGAPSALSPGIESAGYPPIPAMHVRPSVAVRAASDRIACTGYDYDARSLLDCVCAVFLKDIDGTRYRTIG
ncbi:hypothetical protein, partial [Rathayibacter rathayi]|uniref:hypothetical protein n=1 Tax=Rathayibacter rathayi TaxID=33887 RepID=UPI001CA5186D